MDPKEHGDEGVAPKKEVHITPDPDQDERGRVGDALGEPAAPEESGSDGDNE